MLIKQIDPGGRVRRLERRMILGCRICRARLECPDDAEQWGWIKSDDAQGFLRDHKAHGSETTAGWHFEFDEVDEEPA